MSEPPPTTRGITYDASKTDSVALIPEYSFQNTQKSDPAIQISDLEDISLHEEMVRNGQLRTRIPHHSSQNNAPINSLPADILDIIFSLASRDWVNEDYQYIRFESAVFPGTLSLVCVLWRELILRSPVLWAELYIIVMGPLTNVYFERAALWAKRSQNAPLWVTVNDIDPVPNESVEEASMGLIEPDGSLLNDLEISRVIDFLTPLMPRVRELAINSTKHPPGQLVQRLLACWVEYGSVDVAEKLDVCVDLSLSELEVPSISPDTRSERASSYDPSTFWRSLRKVFLENVSINWGHEAYTGLTELYIAFGFHSNNFPTQQNIADLLVANPRLRSLSIHHVRITPGPVPASTPLDYLETLGLESEHTRDLGLILSLITSTSTAIRMSLSLDDNPEFIAAARSFFARTKVTVLHATGEELTVRPSISALFTFMPHLHTLAFHSCNISEMILQELSERHVSHNKPAHFWPALRTLYLLECRTSPQCVRHFLRIYTPVTLWIHELEPEAKAEWNAVVLAETRVQALQDGTKLIWLTDVESLMLWTFVYGTA